MGRVLLRVAPLPTSAPLSHAHARSFLIGMPKGADNAKPGLGTGIIEALAKQLGGNIRVSDTSPGTSFTLVHDEGADNYSPVLSAA